MLVLSRKEGERIQAGEIEIVILKVEGSRVKVGIEAPSHINIKRGEVEDGTDTGFESAHTGRTSQAGGRR